MQPYAFMDNCIPAFFRLLPLLVLFPVPGMDRLPATVRIFFCIAMAICIAGALPSGATGGPAHYISQYAAQFLLGLALALGIHACFAGLHIGGNLIDTQAGTNVVGIFSPAQGSNGVIAEFLVMVTAVVVLLSDSVLLLLGKTLALSPESFSPTDGEQFFALIDLFGKNLIAGFLLTLPVVAGLWLMDVLAAMSSRLLPQSNVYFLFLPIKTLFAILLLMAYSALFVAAADRMVASALVG